ncbi:MAG: hypothetical protein OEU91_10095 [Gammaproteobacteria bacterium]|nr:hypothetical protein [Gammaproteobacteria bacterium]
MMNLFARILSHGFGLIVVALLVIGFIYRGELFPEWELPDFLALDSGSEETTEAVSGDVKRASEPSAEDVADGAVPAPVEVAPEMAEVGTETPEASAELADAPAETVMPVPVETTPAMTEAETVAPEVSAIGGAADEAVPALPEAVPEMAEVETVTPQASAELADAPAEAVIPVPVETTPAMTEAETVTPEAGAGVADTAAQAETVASDADVDSSAATGSVATQAEAVPEVVETLEVVAEEAEPVADTVTETPPDTIRDAATDQVDEVPAPTTAPAAAEGVSAYQVLAAAREAYWLRDYALAEQKYQDLIALEPDNPDGYGELGNMYFSQGGWEQAAAAYYEAGVRLVDQGLIREARQLVEVIRGLNGTQADALEQKTRSAEQ